MLIACNNSWNTCYQNKTIPNVFNNDLINCIYFILKANPQGVTCQDITKRVNKILKKGYSKNEVGDVLYDELHTELEYYNDRPKYWKLK